MVSCGIRPDDFLVVGLMSACARMGHSELVKWVDFCLSDNVGLINLEQAHVVAALIDMNAKSENIDRAKSCSRRNRGGIWCVFVPRYRGCRCTVEGRSCSVFNRMLPDGIVPDEVAFTVILTACGRTALVADGWCYFPLMKDEYSIVTSPDHYVWMVDLLSLPGRLRAAYELVEKIPVEPHATTWGALLRGCRLHGETELAEAVSCRLFKLEPRNGGNYVLMSNIFAVADWWVDVRGSDEREGS